MANFLLTFHGGSMPETKEAQDQAMQAWTGWFGTLGDALVDGGNPITAREGDHARRRGHGRDVRPERLLDHQGRLARRGRRPSPRAARCSPAARTSSSRRRSRSCSAMAARGPVSRRRPIRALGPASARAERLADLRDGGSLDLRGAAALRVRDGVRRSPGRAPGTARPRPGASPGAAPPTSAARPSSRCAPCRASSSARSRSPSSSRPRGRSPWRPPTCCPARYLPSALASPNESVKSRSLSDTSIPLPVMPRWSAAHSSSLKSCFVAMDVLRWGLRVGSPRSYGSPARGSKAPDSGWSRVAFWCTVRHMLTVLGRNSERIGRDNLSAVLREVHRHGAVSRSELAERTGLYRQTIRSLVGQLAERGLVDEDGAPSVGARGRPSLVVRPRTGHRPRPGARRRGRLARGGGREPRRHDPPLGAGRAAAGRRRSRRDDRRARRARRMRSSAATRAIDTRVARHRRGRRRARAPRRRARPARPEPRLDRRAAGGPRRRAAGARRPGRRRQRGGPRRHGGAPPGRGGRRPRRPVRVGRGRHRRRAHRRRPAPRRAPRLRGRDRSPRRQPRRPSLRLWRDRLLGDRGRRGGARPAGRDRG